MASQQNTASSRVAHSSIYRVRVSLVDGDAEDSETEIWRLLELRSGLRLDEVHAVLQIAMGWEDSHLHLFTDQLPYERNSTPARTWRDADSIDEGLDGELETAVTLGKVLTSATGPLFYEYDFGDSWMHLVELIEVIPQDADAPLATVIRGERRCPLEDSGGMHGYAEKLAILADPQDESFAFITDWVSGFRDPWGPADAAAFDPVLFDLAACNAMLREWAAQRTGAEASVARGDGLEDLRLAASAGTELDDLVQRMYPDAQTPFRAYVQRGGADRLARIEAGDAAAMVTPYAWLIRRVGVEGMQLSAAGWMPSAVVSDAMRELGWQDRWYGKHNRENQTLPVQRLRASAQQLGLVRNIKGRLVLSVAARTLLDDPDGLWNFLARALALKHPDDVTRDATLLLAAEIAVGAHTGRGEVFEAIAYGLGALGWRFDARTDTDESVRELTRSSWHTLTDLGVMTTEKYPSTTVVVTPQGCEFALAMLNG